MNNYRQTVTNPTVSNVLVLDNAAGTTVCPVCQDKNIFVHDREYINCHVVST